MADTVVDALILDLLEWLATRVGVSPSGGAVLDRRKTRPQ
jgi:hypothetical protein